MTATAPSRGLKGADLARAAKFCEQGTKFLGAIKEFLQLVSPLVPAAEDDPYQVVGVRAEDPWAMVEKVYRAKAKILHPDTKDTGNEEAYKRLQAAYTQLKERRRP